jgi:hypothetical protein
MTSDPRGNVVVLKLAVPPDIGLVPSTVVPFWKETLPVGLPPCAGVIVATKVTVDPYAPGFGEPTTVVVVEALLTASDTVLEALPSTLESPG